MVVAGARGYGWGLPQQSGGMLLQLRGGACPERLRQNVRNQEVCVALVGHHLREAAGACSGQ